MLGESLLLYILFMDSIWGIGLRHSCMRHDSRGLDGYIELHLHCMARIESCILSRRFTVCVIVSIPTRGLESRDTNVTRGELEWNLERKERSHVAHAPLAP